MLGGANMNRLLDSELHPVIFKINRRFLKRIGGIIVEGQKQKETFSRVTDSNRVHIVPNFAEDFLFRTDTQISDKFQNFHPLKILFLSNLLPGKGHRELLNAFMEMSEEEKKLVQIDFAGKHSDDGFEQILEHACKQYPQITYHGSVGPEKKSELFSKAHIFCLPTYYPYEGQPFTIVEAYASGCAVITSLHSGIPQVFEDKVNGYAVQNKNSAALKELLLNCLTQREELLGHALYNVQVAREKHKVSGYLSQIVDLLNTSIHSSKN